MELFFSGNGILQRGKGLTFDDVLLVPNHSEINSRRHPNLSTKVTKNFEVGIPIISSNMDTVTEIDMARAMANQTGVGIIHRFMPIEEQVKMVSELKAEGVKYPIAASIGVKKDDQERAQKLSDAGVDIITIDIAHGDSVMMFDTLSYVKKNLSHIDIIAGNVATDGGTKRLIEAGADAIKVGIGPGSMCTTRIITGHGVPQLTAVSLCYEEAQKHGIPIIADGGIRNSGDMVKCFAAGASTVMLGSLFAGCLETPGEIKGGQKKYRGMASKDAQVSWRGELPKGMAAEGESSWIPCKGSVDNVLEEMLGGIRSGMTYMNASTIEEMYTSARFVELTASGMAESKPHGVR